MRGDKHIKLGSGRAQAQGAGNKGALLDQAARAGIRIPKGVLVLDTAWDQATLKDLMTITEDGVSIPDGAALLRFLALPRFARPLAVRSAFGAEDGDAHSLAGYFESVLNVPPDDPAAVAAAFKTVLESSLKHKGEFRRDVLVMEMVEAKYAGVAFTEQEHEDDLVNYVAGTAQGLVAGEIEGERSPLAKLHGSETALKGETLPPWQKRLQNVLRGVRRWLGERDWDIEWADDGDRCYLLQVRPVTRATRRNEAFTIANHKEILPDLPSTFMTSVIESCSPGLFAYYRNFDSSLPQSRPFIEVFRGRPYINLSLMSEMMRVFGLPTRLVTDNIGGETDRVYGLNTGRMLRKIISLTLPRFAWAQFRSVNSAQARTREMLRRTENPGDSFDALIEQMRWLYTALVTEMFSLTAAIGPMLLLLRATGTLEEHNARQQTISSRMFSDLEPLREYVARHGDLWKVLKRGELPDDAEFRELWAAYIADYGHRGIYESDIARPRYHDDPAPLLRSLTSPTTRRRRVPARSGRGTLTLPLWWQAGRTMRAREQWRHDCMIGFDRTRRQLLALARREVERGALPDVESLWLLTIEEARRLDEGWMPEDSFFAARREEHERLATYHLPDLFRRFDDLEQFREGAELLEGDRVSGVSLTTGSTKGRAWVLREPATEPPFDGPVILVARSVDAGWISTFSQVVGVVVETGGDLSHGSIILREIGLPAITNAHGVTRTFTNGDHLHLDAASGVVEKVEVAKASTP